MPSISFVEFMHQRVGKNWVLARRTARILQRYGDDVVTLTQAQYKALEQEYEHATNLATFGGGPAQHIIDSALETRDKLHSAKVALLAAEATLALCKGKVPEYVEVRRAETHNIVRNVLAEL